jgi:O-6-methylguanine DNA methyltransferase
VACEEYLELLDCFRTNELARNDRLRVEAHVHQCSKCLQQLTQLKLLAKKMARLHARELKQPLSPSGSARDWYSRVTTDIGNIWIGYSLRGISLVSLGPRDSLEFETCYQRRLHRRVRKGNIPKAYALAVRKAAAGMKAANVPLDMSALSSFERTILLRLKQIPQGEVRPYNWLARESGRPKAVRAVGNAMARNPIPFLLPCHRVVPASGGVGNYGFGSALKRALLKKEGVPVDDLDTWSHAGVRYVGCRSTNIYCYPVCRAARRIRPENRIPFHTAEEALQAGFRSCLHCRPA